MYKFIITADDLGVCKDVNDAIMDCVDSGVIKPVMYYQTCPMLIIQGTLKDMILYPLGYTGS